MHRSAEAGGDLTGQKPRRNPIISRQLSDLSAQLNEKSEQINRTISTINGKLSRLNLGVEVWLSKPISSTDFKEESSESLDPSGEFDFEITISRRRSVIIFGYARVREEWQLAIKRGTQVIWTDRDGDEREEISNLTRPEPLLKTSREVRIAAMVMVPNLLKEIEGKAEAILQAIKEAEKRAADL